MKHASEQRVHDDQREADISPYPDETDDDFIDALVRRSRWLRRYFRLQVEGLENVPERAALLVANHNAGGPFEILMIQHAWRGAFGKRPIRGLTHGMAWKVPLSLLRIPQKMGGILARPDVAKQALSRGMCVLVFPGAENESLRPFSERYSVDFGDRKGFIRVARETGLPSHPGSSAGPTPCTSCCRAATPQRAAGPRQTAPTQEPAHGSRRGAEPGRAGCHLLDAAAVALPGPDPGGRRISQSLSSAHAYPAAVPRAA